MGEIWAQAGKRAGADAGDILRGRVRWLAWLLFGLSAACVALDVTLLALNRDTPQPDTWGFRGAAVLLALAYAGLGQLLARHRPENAIGWLFLIISLFMGVGGLGADYAAYALLTRRGALPGGLMAGWAASWLWPAYIGLLIFALLLFPTGRLTSVRWRSIAWLLAASVGGWIVTLMLKPGPLWFAPFVLNPLTIAGDPAMWKLISNVSGIGTGISILAVMVGLIQRLRCAKGVERQQLKWFAYVSVLIGVIGLINETANLTLGPANKSGPKAFQFLTVAVFLTIPLTVALAILRYRLYDIDRIINHALVYGTLSAGSLLLYVVIVGLFGTLLRTDAKLAAAVVTVGLTVLLFRPLYARVQRVVNRAISPAGALPSAIPETERSSSLSSAAPIEQHQPRAAAHVNQTAGRPVAVLLIAALFLALASAFVLLRLLTPYDGARLSPEGDAVWRSNGVTVAPFVEGKDGLRRGDVVVAVNGRSLESYAQGILDPSAPRPEWRAANVVYTVVRDGRTVQVTVDPVAYPWAAVLAEEWGTVVFAVALLLVSGFVLYKRPHESAARVLFLAGAGMASATTWSFGLQVSDIAGAVGWWLYVATTAGGYLLIWIAMLHFALVFPRPRPILLRWRWIIPLIYIVPYTVLAGSMVFTRLTATSALEWLAAPGQVAGPIQLTYVLLAVAAGARNFRSLRDPVSRLQFRWVLFAGAAAGVAGVLFGVIPELLLGHGLLSWNVLALFGLIVPVSMAFAILRYRLFDIEILVQRALVYSALTAFFVAIYILVVGSMGALFQTSGNLFVSLLATGIAAVLFQPLREGLQRGVNHLIYGERDDPYQVLTRLGRRLESALEPDSVLPTIVETVAQALKLPYAAIELGSDAELELRAVYGDPSLRQSPSLAQVPLVYQNESLGKLLLAPRAAGESFSAADWRLLNDFARQAGIAAHAVRLTDELQHSREQLVTSREEERRRIRRDLHDGLGPALASLAMQADNAREWTHTDPDRIDAALADMTARAQDALQDIRRLVYGLRPPALDELGLVGALKQAAANSSNGVEIEIDAAAPLPLLPAAVEVAAYRIAQETMNNVAQHSHAQKCTVAISAGEELRLEISDDGIGLPPAVRSGVGLISMRERAAELGGSCVIESAAGGGTRVIARLPLPREQVPDG